MRCSPSYTILPLRGCVPLPDSAKATALFPNPIIVFKALALTLILALALMSTLGLMIPLTLTLTLARHRV